MIVILDAGHSPFEFDTEKNRLRIACHEESKALRKFREQNPAMPAFKPWWIETVTDGKVECIKGFPTTREAEECLRKLDEQLAACKRWQRMEG